MSNDDGTPRSPRRSWLRSCAALPWREGPSPWGQGRQYPTQFRPAKDRPIKSGATPRSYRCSEHTTAHQKAAKQRTSDARSRKRAGIDEETRQEILAEQDHRCGGCGTVKQAKRLNFDADHDHGLATQHDHSDDVACLDCMCGYLCRTCNRDLIGHVAQRGARGRVVRTREETAEIFERIARYLRHPPAARVRARRDQSVATDVA